MLQWVTLPVQTAMLQGRQCAKAGCKATERVAHHAMTLTPPVEKCAQPRSMHRLHTIAGNLPTSGVDSAISSRMTMVSQVGCLPLAREHRRRFDAIVDACSERLARGMSERRLRAPILSETHAAHKKTAAARIDPRPLVVSVPSVPVRTATNRRDAPMRRIASATPGSRTPTSQESIRSRGRSSASVPRPTRTACRVAREAAVGAAAS